METKVSSEAVEQVIRDGLIELGAEPADISREATFETLDVDSLDIVELAQIVEEEFGVELNGESVKDIVSVGDVIDLVVSRLP